MPKYHSVLQFYFIQNLGTLSHSHHILCPNITLQQQAKHLPLFTLYPRHTKMRMLEK